MSSKYASELHRQSVVVDLHAHPALKAAIFHRNLARRYGISTPEFWPYSMRTSFDKLDTGGIDVLLSAILVPEKPLLRDLPALNALRITRPETWRELIEPPYVTATHGILQGMEEQAASYTRQLGAGRRPVRFAHTVDELDGLLAQGSTGPIVLVHTIEGAHSLEGIVSEQPGRDDPAVAAEVLGNLQTFFERGVASITLAHFYPNRVVNPCFPFPETVLPLTRWRQVVAEFDLSRGLTALGEQVVERMLELGMVIDLAHATPLARARIYQIAESLRKQGGVMATHVGAYALKPSPYNLQDWELRWLAEHGGVTGVIFMNYWLASHPDKLGLDLVIRTIQHIVDTAGIDAVGFGSDFDGFTDPPDDLVDAAQVPRLTQHLLGQTQSPTARRYSDEDIKKILGGNALRVLREGWRRRSVVKGDLPVGERIRP